MIGYSTSDKLLKYTSEGLQCFYAQRMRLSEGKADGLDAIDVDNGGGMRMLVLPGRGMDIGRLSWNGINLSFISKGGLAHSAYYDSAGMEGLTTFAGGFLATCGLRNSGVPNECEGESFGYHGRIGQTPAEEVSIRRDILVPRPVITISGKVRESRLFGSSLEMDRTLRVYYEENRIEIDDVINNYSDHDEACMILYHFNFGFPLLDENAEFITSHRFDKPVDANALAGVAGRYSFQPPVSNTPEMCFYYHQDRSAGGDAFAACFNEAKGVGVAIHTDPDQLPLLCNWQSCTPGDYVMGIEPCTCYGDGRKAHLDRHQLEYIPKYGRKNVHIEVQLLDRIEMQRLRNQAVYN